MAGYLPVAVGAISPGHGGLELSEAYAVTERKALGAFYTPEDAAHYMAQWAIRSEDDVVLEPSVGDGAFISAVKDVARAHGWERPAFIASEISHSAVSEVVRAGLLLPEEVVVGDFLELAVRPVDVVIGNPPYVRLRALPHGQASSALKAARHDIGRQMETSGSVWMPFVSRAARFLKPGGRLALVLPWDFTYVRYARPLWEHLSQVFGHLRVVRVRERLFPNINQDVLLLCADSKGRSTKSVIFEIYNTVRDLLSQRPSDSSLVSVERVVRGERAFQEALLPSGVLDVLSAARSITTPTRDLVSFNIGYVCGHKQFFHPGPLPALPDSSLRPALTDARSLRRGGLRTSELREASVARLWLPHGPLTEDESRYVLMGESAGVHTRYKTRIRDPWYVVPGVKVPDLILSVFSARPILMVNDRQLVATNSLLCGYLRTGSAASYAAGWYTSLTLLNAELEVHSLGGGVLVLVPKEVGNVRILRPDLTDTGILDSVANLLKAGDMDAAYSSGDAAIERELGTEAVRLIKDGARALEAWRVKSNP